MAVNVELQLRKRGCKYCKAHIRKAVKAKRSTVCTGLHELLMHPVWCENFVPLFPIYPVSCSVVNFFRGENNNATILWFCVRVRVRQTAKGCNSLLRFCTLSQGNTLFSLRERWRQKIIMLLCI